MSDRDLNHQGRVNRRFTNEQEENASGDQPPPPANAANLLNLATGMYTAPGSWNTLPLPMDVLQQQIEAHIQQAQQQMMRQQQQPPPQPPPVPPAMPQQQHALDAIPMLMQAMLSSQQSPSTIPPNTMQVNHSLLMRTLWMAMTQLMQYRQLAEFLMHLLSQCGVNVPTQMLMPGMFPPPQQPQQQQPPFWPPMPSPSQAPPQANNQIDMNMMNLMMISALTGANPTSPQQLPTILAPLLQQLGGIPANNNSNMNTRQSSHTTSLADAAQRVTAGVTMATSGGGPSVAAAARRPAESDFPPMSPPPQRQQRARKKRKYDHESFPEKLHRLVSDAHENGLTDICRFNEDGSRFQILNTAAFEEELLPNYFRHNHISSFKRLLRMYSFRRIQGTWMEGIFEHPLFHRDHPELCKQMQRVESGT
mmetsp:Transcript_4962/g.9453  ORF Transcript_4962/g.9453 Transcript_4962/m.9453 type:complete len:421 (+) Transcript_4962:35-1297(+)|eukprot:scaffold11998_cov174-Amphora_coffeaeformis.AAC.11